MPEDHVVPFWLGRIVLPDPRIARGRSIDSMLAREHVGSSGTDDWVVLSDQESVDVSGRLAKSEYDGLFGFGDEKDDRSDIDHQVPTRLQPADLPVVVHAVGAPLFGLPGGMTIHHKLGSAPDVESPFGWEKFHRKIIESLGAVAGSVRWCHDVLVDDFAVAQRLSLELSGERSGNPYPPVLSPELLGARVLNGSVRRAWIAAGLPLSEGCIRQRFASMARRHPSEAPGSFGLLVNRTIGIQESDLLSWYDFQFCCSPAEPLADGFEQIAAFFNERAGGLT